MRNCHLTVGTFLRNIGGTERVIADWMKNEAPPELPKATKKIEPAAPPEAPDPAVDLNTVPAWAAPMADALFVIMGRGNALPLLCKGWLHMARTFAPHCADATLRQLFLREGWEDDSEDTPFEFRGDIYRVVEAPQ